MNWFAIENVRDKIRYLPEALAEAERLSAARMIRESIGRDVPVVLPHLLPDKLGLSLLEGQARLMHDLGSIELQAMELATRGLYEFPDAPTEFRAELADLALGEARHLGLCLDAIEALGFSWGHWNVHLSLWNTVSSEDTLLDRILIVHRYLEGSGLDAGDSILRRLKGVRAELARSVVETIVREEIDHVAFGSRWYRRVAELTGVDPERDFCARIGEIAVKAPRRERLSYALRERAGFTAPELKALAQHVPK